MTTNERFLSVLHRITSCRHLATVNITIWNRRIEVRHTVFDEMYILRSFPLPNTHNISIHALREEGDSKNRDKISIFKQIVQHSARI